MIALTLIVVTIASTVMAWYIFPHWQFHGMLKPYEVWYQGKWYQTITSGMLHADGTHLFVNMLVFFFFGPVLEQTVGAFLFLLLYLTALVFSNLPTIFLERDRPQYASLGASGAVESVLFGYIVLYPLNPIYLFFIPVGIPAVIFGALFLLYSYFEARRKKDRINHTAHIAGAVYGMVYVLLFVPDAVGRFLEHFG